MEIEWVAPKHSTFVKARSRDDANRLASITIIFSSIDYGYDDAGRKRHTCAPCT